MIDSQLPTFRNRIGAIFKGNSFGFLKMGYIGCSETSVATKESCVISLKSEDILYTAAESCNHIYDGLEVLEVKLICFSV